MKQCWLAFWLVIALREVSCIPRDKIGKHEMAQFETANSVLNQTVNIRNTVAEDISEGLKHQVKLSKNATKAMEKLANLLNNGSLSIVDTANYLPSIVLKDSRMEVSQFFKNLRKNAIRNAATFNHLISTISNITGSEETLPSKFGIREPATILDTVSGFGKILTDSVFNTMYWSTRSVPTWFPPKIQPKVVAITKNDEEDEDA